MDRKTLLAGLVSATVLLGACATEKDDTPATGGNSFKSTADLSLGLKVEYQVTGTATTLYFTEVGSNKFEFEEYANQTTSGGTDGTNDDQCLPNGRTKVETTNTGPATRHIVGSQQAWITPGDVGDNSTNATFLNYREGHLDIVEPAIDPQSYADIDCDCEEQYQVAEVELFYIETNRVRETQTVTNRNTFVDGTTGTSEEEVQTSQDTIATNTLEGQYGLEGYFWSLEFLDDAGIGSTNGIASFPVDLQAGYAGLDQEIPVEAKVGDTWFYTFGTVSYLRTVVAEETLTIGGKEYKTLKVVNRGHNQDDFDGSILETSCISEYENNVFNGDNQDTVVTLDDCNQTSWINESTTWYYNNVMVKMVSNSTTVNVTEAGYIGAIANDEQCPSVVNTNVPENTTDNQVFVRYNKVQNVTTWEATSIEEDASIEASDEAASEDTAATE
jgi:hypothetical protein